MATGAMLQTGCVGKVNAEGHGFAFFYRMDIT